MEEIKVLLDNYDSQHNLASTGFHLGGQKYFYLRYFENTSLYLKSTSAYDDFAICSVGTTTWCAVNKGKVESMLSRPIRYVVFKNLKAQISVLQAVILGLYEEPMQPAEAATVTETLGDYLKGAGY